MIPGDQQQAVDPSSCEDDGVREFEPGALANEDGFQAHGFINFE